MKFTAAQIQKIANAMCLPLRTRLNYTNIAQKLFMVPANQIWDTTESKSKLVDLLADKSYNVRRRRELHYRGYKHNCLNINRVPYEFAASLEKGYPLMLTNDRETFFLTMYKRLGQNTTGTWQNIQCTILSATEFCEILEAKRDALQLNPKQNV